MHGGQDVRHPVPALQGQLVPGPHPGQRRELFGRPAGQVQFRTVQPVQFLGRVLDGVEPAPGPHQLAPDAQARVVPEPAQHRQRALRLLVPEE